MGKKLTVNLKAESLSETKTSVRVRNFQIKIDEPPQLGGEDEAPNPVEYLLAALSGCLNVMAHLIAKEKGIKLNGLKIDIEGELDLDGLMGKGDVRPGFEKITVKIHPETDAPEGKLKEWLKEIERRCPVSDNISNVTPVKITLK